jgi:hypothetical protein
MIGVPRPPIPPRRPTGGPFSGAGVGVGVAFDCPCAIVIDSAVESVKVCAAERKSLAVMVKFDVPAVVGVPEMTPVEELSERPVGREPEVTDQVSVPWLCEVPTLVKLQTVGFVYTR